MSVLVGRFFQLVGMIVLPVGLLIGMSGGDLRTEEAMLFIGAGFFLVGWLMARSRTVR
jgi:hypothetical protein